jgi:hypothetical protein
METMTDHRNELALIRERQLAKVRQAAGKPERFSLRFACATHDREFQATFARLPPAERFTCETIERSEGKASALGRLHALFRPAETLSVPASEVDLSGVACAWCAGSNTWTRCDVCRAFVCQSRSKPGYFVCRPSCGRQCETVPLTHLNAARNPVTGTRTPLGGPAATPLLGKRRQLRIMP